MRSKAIPLITYSIVLFGALFGWSCKCDKDAIECPSLTDVHYSWVGSIAQDLTLTGDSGNSATIALLKVDTNLQDVAKCYDRPYGGCSCEACLSSIEISLTATDTNGIIKMSFLVSRTFEYEESSRNNGQTYDELRIEAGKANVWASLPLSNPAMEYLPSITIKGKTYTDVYIARGSKGQGTNIETPYGGYLAFSADAGIIEYQGTQSAEVFTRD